MDLFMNWAFFLSAYGHGSVRLILQGPSGFILILFKHIIKMTHHNYYLILTFLSSLSLSQFIQFIF